MFSSAGVLYQHATPGFPGTNNTKQNPDDMISTLCIVIHYLNNTDNEMNSTYLIRKALYSVSFYFYVFQVWEAMDTFHIGGFWSTR